MFHGFSVLSVYCRSRTIIVYWYYIAFFFFCNRYLLDLTNCMKRSKDERNSFTFSQFAGQLVRFEFLFVTRRAFVLRQSFTDAADSSVLFL